MKKLILILCLGIFSAPAYADLKIDTAPFVSIQMNESNDKLFAVARYANGCSSPWESFYKLKNNKIMLFHVAQSFTDIPCTRAVEFQEVVFDLSDIPTGIYQLIDGFDGTVIGELKHYKEVYLLNSNESLE